MARPEQQSVSGALGQAIEATGRLVVENVRLARVELEQQAALAARGALLFGLALAVGLAGYGLLCAGAGVVLSRWMGWEAALLALAGANLLGGTLFFARGMKKVSRRPAPLRPPGAVAPARPSLELTVSSGSGGGSAVSGAMDGGA